MVQAGPHSQASLHIYRSLDALQTSSGMQLRMFSAWFNLCDRAQQVHSQVWLIVEVFKKTVKIIGRNWSRQSWAMTGQIDQLEQGPDLHLLMIKA